MFFSVYLEKHAENSLLSSIQPDKNDKHDIMDLELVGAKTEQIWYLLIDNLSLAGRYKDGGGAPVSALAHSQMQFWKTKSCAEIGWRKAAVFTGILLVLAKEVAAVLKPIIIIWEVFIQDGINVKPVMGL